MNLDVVVVTYNSADHVTDALVGPLEAGASVVVVDNASSDETVPLARSLGVAVSANDRNRGFGAAANQGAALGSADLLLLLNPDARIGAASLARMVEAMQADPDLAVLSPRVVHPGGTEQRVWWPFPSSAASWREALGLHRFRRRRDDEVREGFVIGAVFMIRREVFERLGGFDPRFWLYGEETDLCRRVLDAGRNVGVLDEVEATHVGAASSEGAEGVAFEHFNRGLEIYVDKHAGRAALLSARLAVVVGSAIRAVALRDPKRRAYQRARLRRSLRLLLTHPTQVPVGSPGDVETPRRDTEVGQGAGCAHDVGHARELVVCSLEAWDDTWRRNQFLVRELLAREPTTRVLFVEPPFDPLHALRQGGPGRRSDLTRRRGLRPLVDARVVRFQPLKLGPRKLGAGVDRALRRQVRRAAQQAGFTRPTLWINDAAYAALARETEWPALYDITDDWLEAAPTVAVRRRLESAERVLFRDAGAVVVCSEGLARTRLAGRPDLRVIPNAVDSEHFTTPRRRPSDLPAGPSAVYVGTLHEDRLDVALVVRLASARPDLGVVLVGPDALSVTSRARLEAHANVHLLGARPYDAVPGYLQHADVVIVPHGVTPFTESLDPIKAYECLAVGRPTVATPVAGFRDLGEPVRCATAERFVDVVDEVLSAPVGTAPQEVPSWAERAAAFKEALDDAEARATEQGATRAELTPAESIPPGDGRVRYEVVYVDHCARLSGAELALARVLPTLRHVHATVILGEHGPLEALLVEGGADVEVLPLDPELAATRRDEVGITRLGPRRVVSAWRAVWDLRARLLELEPDLVHTNSLKAAVYGGMAGRLAGIPVVWHMRDRIAPDYLPRPVVVAVRALARVIPSAVICNSMATRSTLGRHYPTGVVPSPVVYDTVARIQGPAHGEHSAFSACLVGRMAPWKGQDVFLRAFAAAFPDGDERAVLVGSALFGEDEWAAGLAALAGELGMSDRVEFRGFVEDVPTVLSETDVLVHASIIPEPFGQVVVEGMAAGLSVIAAAAGGPLEVVTDGVDGLLTPPGDVDALAIALRRLRDDPELCRRLGSAALETSKAYAPERVAELIEEAYARILGR